MMLVDGADPVSIRIHEKLIGLTPNAPECCIFRVHTQLRKTNEKAYEPQLLAIGPYHRGKDDLRLMENHKLHYLQLLLHRRRESNVETYIKAIRELEGRAREFYAEPISLTTDEFVEMMLLDGFFIIELLRKRTMKVLMDEYDPIFQLGWMFYSLMRDLLLFENQIPFFLLTKLFEMTEVPNRQNNLIDVAIHFIRVSLPCGGHICLSCDGSLQNIKHLLALVYKSFTSPSVEIGIGWSIVHEEEWSSIPSAIELQEAGVKFKKLDKGTLFDIKFNNGVMEIPLMKIEERSESIFRNLAAYEQYSQNNHLKFFTGYVSFMGYLINSPKDVEFLRRRGIIENFLGDDEAVSTMFKNLGDNAIVFNLHFAELFRNVNKHCRKRQNVWIANLKHNYFSSPWAFISFLAAALLLLFTLTQTIFSILS
ncbi:UPF0481 protein At3g47200-like [Corylus avellana]|uniref:UPF0481 protein At3g47200-like n=1 Tax=Corylus avellana TaxID=13451 RepID=UPI001E23E7B7|nr:UPF0481 protein At3g47200-like [Corylus avellana]